jgi:ribonuclease D
LFTEHFLGIGSTIANVATCVAIDLEGSHFGEENSDISLLQVKFDHDPLAYVIDVRAVNSSVVFGSNSWFKKLVESHTVTKLFFDGRKDVLIMNRKCY